MLRRQSDSHDFQVAAADFATVGVVAGADIGGGAGKKDDAKSRELVLAVKIVEALFFSVVGFVAIDDFVEVTPDTGLFHRLMFVAPAAGGHESIAQTGFLCFL